MEIKIYFDCAAVIDVTPEMIASEKTISEIASSLTPEQICSDVSFAWAVDCGNEHDGEDLPTDISLKEYIEEKGIKIAG